MKVTTVLLSFNRSAFLDQALASIQDQTHQNWELILSDCSTDTAEAKKIRDSAERFSLANPDKVFFTAHGARLLQSENLHFALAQVKSEFVAFLHDDDIWLPTHLERALAWLSKSPTNALVTTDAKIIDESGRFQGALLAGRKPPLSTREWANLLLRSYFGSFSGFVARMQFGKGFPLYENGIIDIHYALHILANGGVLKGFARPSYLYRVHNVSVSGQMSLLKERHKLRLWLARRRIVSMTKLYPLFPLLAIKSLFFLAVSAQKNP